MNKILISVYAFLLFVITFLYYTSTISILHFVQGVLAIAFITSLHITLMLAIFKYQLHRKDKLDLIFNNET